MKKSELKAIIKEELSQDAIQMMSGNVNLRKEQSMLENAMDIFMTYQNWVLVMMKY